MIKNELVLFMKPIYINIENAKRISVFTALDANKDREIPYVAECETQSFSFGRYYSYEDFIIALRSQFVQNEDTAEMLTMLKKITSNNTVETEDDGITQKITAQQGTSLHNAVKATPIKKLSPYRTFYEVEQPTSEFLFRVKDGGGFALFEADGGAWIKTAKDNIKGFFLKELANEINTGNVVVVG